MLTDIIRQCDIPIDAVPIDFTEAIPVTVPELPGRVAPAASAELRPRGDIRAEVEGVSYDRQSGSALPPLKKVSNLGKVKVVPTADARGVGVRGTSDVGGLKMTFEALLQINYRVEGAGGIKSKPMTMTDQTQKLASCPADPK